ncbi:hypothetical protein ACOB9N_04125, partial [Pasteurella multocida]|uniref:hypothetical protein n=1 Tax=Pasteurella multocida TaxID=747 RepID=UPI003B9EB45E
GLEWSSTDGRALSDCPEELEPVIAALMKDSTYALPILSPLFKEFSQNNEPVTATASVKLKKVKATLIMSFPDIEKKRENDYIRTLFFRLLTDSKSFLREVKALEKKLY